MNRLTFLGLSLLFASPAFSDSECTMQEPWKFQETDASWPALDSTIKKDECVQSRSDIIEYLRQNDLTDGPPGTYFTVDINNDGQCEFFVSMPAWSGSGGTYWEIYTTQSDAPYQSIGGIQAWDFKYLTPSNGFAQLESSDLSGGYYIKHLHAFNNGAYQTNQSVWYECDETSGTWIVNKTTHGK